MFILNPYDRYFNKSTNAPKAPQPSNVSAQGPARRFMDSITRSRKASPVLSVNTACASTPVTVAAVTAVQPSLATSCIPFPSSAPIPCPSLPNLPEFDSDSILCIDGSSSLFTWPISVQPASCEATEAHFHALPAEVAKPRLPIGKAASNPVECGRPGGRVRVVSGGHGVFNIEHASPNPKTSRREKSVERKRCHSGMRKPGRKSVSDVKFLIALHQSISWHLRSSDTAASGQALTAQDKLLAEKLWNNIAKRGHDPGALLLNFTPSVDSEPPTNDPFSFTAPSLIPTPPSPSDVLTMSQVVASLTLRHRTQTRVARPAPGCGSRTRDTKSPLSEMHIAPEISTF